MEFAGKTVLVTGGASGIGRSYVDAFSARGARVVAVDVRRADGDGDGADAEFHLSDVTDIRSLENLAANVGPVDVLVNNAAMYVDIGEKRPFDRISSDEWAQVMAVNVQGVWNVVRSLVRNFNDDAAIVNIASASVFTGPDSMLHYVASKGAVVSMTRSLARALGKRAIRVNTVAPGMVDNDSSRTMHSGDYLSAAVQQRAIKRPLTTADVLGAVMFLASEHSRMITGQCLVVDGGVHFH